MGQGHPAQIVWHRDADAEHTPFVDQLRCADDGNLIAQPFRNHVRHRERRFQRRARKHGTGQIE